MREMAVKNIYNRIHVKVGEMCSQVAGKAGLDMLLCLWEGRKEGGRAEWEAKGMGQKGEETERGIAPPLLNDF